MLRKAIRRGWSDSLASLGGPPLAFTLLVVPLVGFVLHFAISGWAAMAPEFDVWSVYGVAATGLVLLLLFSYHVMCAPYRIERDRIAQLEADLARAEADLSANSARRPDLVIYISTTFPAGDPCPETTRPGWSLSPASWPTPARCQAPLVDGP
ncbi:hypothetical protein HNP73_002552 [Amaricoccus macauensis]|uniref:Uncharacterized protein n=1 Tax=Amaricoccus macauensis TaxID=57001 RepID=A0A840SS04_9RHOB|nr:hypothetical protein [Amaricoccus macauensis]MBB5222616.1 hypothetical protein [Amaricoccus macauensis]